MKKLTITITSLIISLISFGQTEWKTDPAHSKVGFSITHLVISEIDGNFNTFNGTLSSENEDFNQAKISFSIDASSIDTDNDQRDGHLKSEDFFHATKYPKMTFESTSFKKKNGENYILKGLLTIRGVTKNVTFGVTYGGTTIDGYGNTKAGFKATTSIDRTDYGVAWNSKTEHGTLTVGNDVDLTLKLQFVKQ